MKTLEILNAKIESTQNSINSNMERLTRNFNHEFTWVTESLVSDNIKLREYKNAVTYGLDVTIEELEKFVSRPYNVRNSSTCELTNFKSTVVFVTIMKLLEELKGLQ